MRAEGKRASGLGPRASGRKPFSVPVLCSLFLSLTGVAHADPAPDLVLHEAPVQMKMRAPVRHAKKKVAAATQDPAPAASATSFAPVPTSARDLAERVIVRIRAGYELDSAPASGQTFVGGDSLPSRFAGSRPWLLGDAVLGARDILLPSLGAYFLSSFQFDTSGALPTRTALVVPGDATDQRIAIKAGYAEYGTEDRPGSHLWLRAGRQYRLDAGAMFAYYDGATIGWKAAAWNVSAFAGQRVALYVDTPAGLELGGTAALDLERAAHVPVQLAADVQAMNVAGQLRSLVSLGGTSAPTRTMKLDVTVRAIDSGSGLGFGRADARLRWTPSRSVVLVADAEQRSGGDVAYDLAAPSAVDVVEIAQKLGVGLAAPIDATTLGARADLRRGPYELLAFGRVELPEGTVTAVDQQGWVELGAAASAVLAGTWTTAQYKLRRYFLDGNVNAAGMPFDDTAGTGISTLHELAVDTTWRPSGPAGRRWHLGGGLFYRIYDLQSPYVAVANDGRAGGRANVQWWLSEALHVEVAGDLAQSDPLLQRQLGVLSSVRAAMEARW